MFRLRFNTLAIAGLLVTSSAAPAQVMYSITDLGLPGGFSFNGARANDLNNAGQVTGVATSVSPFAPPSRAFRYTPGVGNVDLGSLATNGTSSGSAINSFGQVAGRTDIGGGRSRAFRFTDGVGMVDLGVLPGLLDSSGEGINDLGHVVGFAGIAASATRAFRYTDAGGLVDLGLPAGTTGGISITVNNAGRIALTAASSPGNVFSAYRHTDATGYVNLGTLGGTNSRALGINNIGDIVGRSDTAAGDVRAFVYSDGSGMTSLGILSGGSYSFALAINDNGTVVGIGDSPAGSERAFVFQNGSGMLDLNTLINPGTGWTLTFATGINDLGQITGTGFLGGNQRAFLLTPIPEPSSFCLIGCVLAVGVRCRLFHLLSSIKAPNTSECSR